MNRLLAKGFANSLFKRLNNLTHNACLGNQHQVKGPDAHSVSLKYPQLIDGLIYARRHFKLREHVSHMRSAPAAAAAAATAAVADKLVHETTH